MLSSPFQVSDPVRIALFSLFSLLLAPPLLAEAEAPASLSTDSLAMSHPSMQAPVYPVSFETLVAERQIAPSHDVSVRTMFDRLQQRTYPTVYIDRSTLRPSLLLTEGEPWIPGPGNSLSNWDIARFQPSGAAVPANLETLEAIALDYVERNRDVLRVAPEDLVLNLESSGFQQPEASSVADETRQVRTASLNFQWVPQGIPVKDAVLSFRIKGGNLIMIGMRYIGDPQQVPAMPILSEESALEILEDYLSSAETKAETLSEGTIEVYPATLAIKEPNLDFRMAWTFELSGPQGVSWKAGIDALTAELLFVRALVSHSCPAGFAKVKGGVRSFSANGTALESSKPMPFADFEFPNPTGSFADESGCFPVISAPGSKLNGKFFKISALNCPNTCILLQPSTTDLDFGSAACPLSTDCNSTSQHTSGACGGGVTDGGGGNTTAARTLYHELHLARSSILDRYVCTPGTPGCWQDDKVSVRSNVDFPSFPICNARYNRSLGGVLEFGTSSSLTSASCRNYGELASIIYHEYGHFVDHKVDGNDRVIDEGSSEAYSDIFSTILTRNSCYGVHGQHGGDVACGNQFKYSCNSCDGARELDYRKRGVDMLPGGVSEPAQPRTPTRSMTFCPSAPAGAAGPCGLQSHCESHVASEAFWDLAAEDLPAMGLSSEEAWDLASNLWFKASKNLTRMYECGDPKVPGMGPGANTGTLFMELLVADDCDNNLANGTPHASAIFAALDRHEIAAGSASDPQYQSTPCVEADLRNDFYFLYPNAPRKILGVDLLANDSGQGLAFDDLVGQSHGTLTPITGGYSYQPFAGFSGTDSATYTVTGATGMPTGNVHIETFGGAPGPIDDFESGISSQWQQMTSSAGTLHADAAGALRESQGLRTNVSAPQNHAYVTANVGSLNNFTAAFQFDPSGMNMQNYERHVLFEGTRNGIGNLFQIRMDRNGAGQPRLQIRAWDANRVVTESAWTVIEPPVAIKVEFQAFQVPIPTGGFRLTIDGKVSAELINDNGHSLNAISLGVVRGGGMTTVGEHKIDSFVSSWIALL